MVEIQMQVSSTLSTPAKQIDRRGGVTVSIPPSPISLPPQNGTARLRAYAALDVCSPVNQNGSFEFDRVIKCGYIQKRTQKTKAWKTIYLVLRPNALSIYKTEKEDKLRHKIFLSDVTAVTLLKDPKHKRQNVFGLFSPSRNFHFQAKTLKDAQDWVDLIRKDARIEEEEEEMFLASPVIRRQSYMPTTLQETDPNRILSDVERLASSSPEPIRTAATASSNKNRRQSQLDSSGMSGTEIASHSDFSDTDIQRIQGTSIESLAVQSPPPSSGQNRAGLSMRNISQASGLNIEQDYADRVIWQGRLLMLRNKAPGVRAWKNSWAVLRPRNLILYKDESEYSAHFIVPLSSILNVVEIDPVSKTKTHCLQIITEEKSYRFCACDEESLVHCLGAFKSLLAKRRELEMKAAEVAMTAIGGMTATTVV